MVCIGDTDSLRLLATRQQSVEIKRIDLRSVAGKVRMDFELVEIANDEQRRIVQQRALGLFYFVMNRDSVAAVIVNRDRRTRSD